MSCTFWVKSSTLAGHADRAPAHIPRSKSAGARHKPHGFAGRRVIETTIKQKLPPEFQTSEYLLEHGFLDKIVARKDLKAFLAKTIRLLTAAK